MRSLIIYSAFSIHPAHDVLHPQINFYNGSYVIIGLSTKNTTSGDPGNPYYYKTNDFVNYTSAGPGTCLGDVSLGGR